MKRNFKIDTGGFLLDSGLFIELHSEFMLTKFEYNLLDRVFTMHWDKMDESWVKNYEFDQLQVIFNKVSLLKISPRDSEYPYKEDLCIWNMGFLRPEDIDIMNGYLDDELMRNHGNTDDYHMIFLFYSETAIKIYAEEVKLVGIKEGKKVLEC